MTRLSDLESQLSVARDAETRARDKVRRIEFLIEREICGQRWQHGLCWYMKDYHGAVGPNGWTLCDVSGVVTGGDEVGAKGRRACDKAARSWGVFAGGSGSM